MGLGRNPELKGDIHGRKHSLLVVLEVERQNAKHPLPGR